MVHEKGNPKKQKGNKAVIKAAKSNPQRWRKGQSCVYNPSVTKHRDAAKKKSGADVTNNYLSQKLLAEHDSKFDGMSVDDDNMSVRSGGSVVSSIASNCTNETFGKVLGRIMRSQTSLSTQIIAIVGAVTDTIDKSNSEQSDPACCAVLLSMLNSETETLNLDQKMAVVHLLNLFLKRVPRTILQAKSREVLTALNITSEEEREEQSLVKSMIACWAHCLRAQTQNAWQLSLIRETYAKILNETISPKPKIRKAAQHAVCAILRGSNFMTTGHGPVYHPAAIDTANFCKNSLESMKAASNTKGVSHVLMLLQNVLSTFSTSGIKSTCDLVLTMLGSTDVILRNGVFLTLENLFSMSPKPENLTPDLNCKIINALFDFEPQSDPVVMISWLKAMEKAYCNLSKIQTKPTNVDQMMDKLISMMEKNPHDKVFNSFKAIGTLYPSTLKKVVPKLQEVYMIKDYSRREEIEKALGLVVQIIGPREVLDALPLQITGDSDTDGDFPRSWIIPVFRDHIKDAELGFFTEYFLPLATKINDTCNTLKQQKGAFRAQAYNVILKQIWSLLPSFCRNPTDLATSFKKIAQVIGKTIESRSENAMAILAALRKLLVHCLDKESDKAALAHYAKNFVLIFCRLCIKKDENKSDEAFRLSILDTLKCYLKIAPEHVVIDNFETCFTKLHQEEENLNRLKKEEQTRKENSKPKCFESVKAENESLEKWCCLMDLGIAIVPFTPAAKVEKIRESLAKNLQSSEGVMQKKSYRLLAVCPKEIICEQLPLLIRFRNEPDTQVAVANPSAQAPRLKCLGEIIELLQMPEVVEFVELLVPEVVLCTKANSKKAKDAASNLLVKMGKKLISCLEDRSPQESVQRYFQLFLSGLRVNDPHVISCTVQALAGVMFHFREYTTDDIIGHFCDIACALLSHNSREIIQSALCLVQVLLGGHSDVMCGRYLKNLVTGINQLHNISACRKKVKFILQKLVKKCGTDVLFQKDFLSPVYIKVLKNLQKKETKDKSSKKSEEKEKDKKKHRSDDALLDDSDDEDDDEEMKDSKDPKVFIKEDEEILDFMDASASKKLTTSKPRVASKKDKTGGFKVAEDGRLIISELDDKTTGKADSGKKRKRDEDEDEDDIDEAMSDSVSTASYKTGGRGIHRDRNQNTKSEAKTPKPKKAKKSDGQYAYQYIQLNSNKRKHHESQQKLKQLFKKMKV